MKSININSIEAGDTLLYKSKGFIPKVIRFFMKKYLKKKYKKELNEINYTICNHMATVISFNDDLYISEAIAKGYVIRKLENYVFKSEIFIYRPVNGFLKNEIKNLSEYAMFLSFKKTGYEFFNFIWWMVYISTNFRLFIGGIGEKKVFCFESAFRCLQAAGKYPLSVDPYFLTSVDLQENNDFYLFGKLNF